MKALLDAGADVNARDTLGRTPLMWAIPARNLGVVRVLLRAGANVNVRDKRGATPQNMVAGNADYGFPADADQRRVQGYLAGAARSAGSAPARQR